MGGRDWGFTVLYSGYVKVNLRIPQFPQWGNNFDASYPRQPICIWHPNANWYSGNPKGDVIDKWAELQQTDKRLEEHICKYGHSGPVGTWHNPENVFNLSTMKGLIITSKEVTLSPFEMQTVSSISKVTGHVRWVHVISEPGSRASPMK